MQYIIAAIGCSKARRATYFLRDARNTIYAAQSPSALSRLIIGCDPRGHISDATRAIARANPPGTFAARERFASRVRHASRAFNCDHTIARAIVRRGLI